jgi:predicted ATPase
MLGGLILKKLTIPQENLQLMGIIGPKVTNDLLKNFIKSSAAESIAKTAAKAAGFLLRRVK